MLATICVPCMNEKMNIFPQITGLTCASGKEDIPSNDGLFHLHLLTGSEDIFFILSPIKLCLSINLPECTFDVPFVPADRKFPGD